VFIIADRGTGERYVIPAKAADESTIRLLLAVGQQESLTVYTDGFRAYNHLARTTHSFVNTSSTGTVSTLMETFT
jgi:transposase-like protein